MLRSPRLSAGYLWQVLNLLLYQLTHRKVDEALMEFLRVDEHLVDVGDDLVDYEVGAPIVSRVLKILVY